MLASGLVLALGCGDSHGAGPCDELDFDPCGGDPTGMWSVVSSCTEQTIPPPDPPAAECEGFFTVNDWWVEGTIWYASHSGFEADMRVLVDGDVDIDGDCAVAIAGAELSEAGCMMLRDELLAESEFLEAECRLEPEACHCDVTLVELFVGGGAWMQEGTRLVHGGTPVPTGEDYCVEGSSMRQRAQLEGAPLYLLFERID